MKIQKEHFVNTDASNSVNLGTSFMALLEEAIGYQWKATKTCQFGTHANILELAQANHVLSIRKIRMRVTTQIAMA